MRKSLFVLLSVFFSLPAFAAEPEFSADMAMTAGGQAIPAKVYYSKQKARFEMHQAISITRMDEGATYILLPSQKTYMRQPIDEESMAKIGAVGSGEASRVPMGKERVNGVDTQKFKITYTGKQGTMEAYQWLDKNEFPVRIEAVDGSWSVEYSNLVPGPQPASLFVIPDGYTEFQMPSLGELSGSMGSAPIPGPRQLSNADQAALQGMDSASLEQMAEQLKKQFGAGSED